MHLVKIAGQIMKNKQFRIVVIKLKEICPCLLVVHLLPLILLERQGPKVKLATDFMNYRNTTTCFLTVSLRGGTWLLQFQGSKSHPVLHKIYRGRIAPGSLVVGLFRKVDSTRKPIMNHGTDSAHHTEGILWIVSPTTTAKAASKAKRIVRFIVLLVSARGASVFAGSSRAHFGVTWVSSRWAAELVVKQGIG